MSETKPPETIWLIRHDTDDYSWCDSPDPSDGIEEADVYKYRRNTITIDEAVEAAGAEEELNGEMPDRIWHEAMADKEVMAEMLRMTVRLTKENIVKALRKLGGQHERNNNT